MRKLLLAITSLLSTGTALVAQQPVKMSLDDCINYALTNSVAMKNARLDTRIQEAQVKQTTATAYPQISGKADLVHFSPNHQQYSFFDASAFNNAVPKGTIAPLPFTIPYTSSASITASQLLFDGSVMVALMARNSIMDLAHKSEAVTAENIRHSVYKAYYGLVIAHKQFDIIQNSLSLARQMESDLQKTMEAGFAEKIDVDRTSVQVNNLAADSMKVANMLIITEQMLKLQLGMDMNTRIFLTDTNIERHKDKALSLIGVQEDYNRVPEFAVLQAALRLNEYDLKRYKLSALPTVAAFMSRGANYGAATFSPVVKEIFKDDNGDGYRYIEYYNGGLSINVPLFGGFSRAYHIREARLKIEKSRNDITNLKQGLDFQVASARANLRNSLLQVQSQKRNLELSNSVLDLAQKKYKAGVGSNLEVTTAQTDLLRAQNNYFAALLDLMNAEADLKKSLGMMK